MNHIPNISIVSWKSVIVFMAKEARGQWRYYRSLLAAAVASLRRVAATRRRSFNCKQAEKVSLSKKRRRGKEVNVRETTRQPCCFNEVLIINLFDCLEHQLLSKTSRPLSTALWSMVVLPLIRCSWNVLSFWQFWFNFFLLFWTQKTNEKILYVFE